MVNFSTFVKAVFLEVLILLLHGFCGLNLKILYIWVFSKSQIEGIAPEETQTVKKLDTAEPAGVMGWEVLEAEGTITEKQTENEDTSGLVKAIVGVFHKG